MDFQQIQQNLLGALGQLLSLRLIVSSPNEKVADLPALYALVAALMAPLLVVALAVVGFVARYSARFEREI